MGCDVESLSVGIVTSDNRARYTIASREHLKANRPADKLRPLREQSGGRLATSFAHIVKGSPLRLRPSRFLIAELLLAGALMGLILRDLNLGQRAAGASLSATSSYVAATRERPGSPLIWSDP